MSDFYAGRRTLFADIGGLAGLGVGAMLAAMTVWKVLATGFRTGQMEKAFAVFLAVVVTAAAVGGAIGLVAGRFLASRWEQRHRRQRPMPRDDVAPMLAAPPQAPEAHATSTIGTFATRPLGAEASRALALLQPSGEPAVPWGVWDGPRMVAVAWVSQDTAGVHVTRAIAESGYALDAITADIRAAAVRH